MHSRILVCLTITIHCTTFLILSDTTMEAFEDTGNSIVVAGIWT